MMKRILCALSMVCLLVACGLAEESGEQIYPEWVEETKENGEVLYLPWGIPLGISVEECQRLLLERAGVEMRQDEVGWLDLAEGQQGNVLGFPIHSLWVIASYENQVREEVRAAEEEGVPYIYSGGHTEMVGLYLSQPEPTEPAGAPEDASAQEASSIDPVLRQFAQFVQRAQVEIGPITRSSCNLYVDGIEENYAFPMQDGAVDSEAIGEFSRSMRQASDADIRCYFVVGISNVALSLEVGAGTDDDDAQWAEIALIASNYVRPDEQEDLPPLPEWPLTEE